MTEEEEEERRMNIMEQSMVQKPEKRGKKERERMSRGNHRKGTRERKKDNNNIQGSKGSLVSPQIKKRAKSYLASPVREKGEGGKSMLHSRIEREKCDFFSFSEGIHCAPPFPSLPLFPPFLVAAAERNARREEGREGSEGRLRN